MLRSIISKSGLGTQETFDQLEANHLQAFKDNSKKKSMVEVSKDFFQEGDVLQVFFNIVNTGLKKIEASETQNGKPNSLIQVSASDMGKSNYISKPFSLYFTILEVGDVQAVQNVMSALTKLVFGDFISEFMTSQIILESTQLKIVYPPSRVSSRRSIGISQPGKRLTENYVTGNRAFLLAFSSNDLNGDIDDSSLRINFAVSALMNTGAVISQIGNSENLIEVLCRVFTRPLHLNVSGDGPNKKSMELRLMIKTNRAKAIFPFYPVDYISPTGFVSDSKASAYSINEETGHQPEVSNNGSQNSTGTNDSSTNSDELAPVTYFNTSKKLVLASIALLTNDRVEELMGKR